MLHAFSRNWLKYLSDPFAVVGVSVLADDKRVSKQYRSVAKILRPDISVSTDPEAGEFITQLFARLVNPAYEKIKQEQGRAETLAMMRLQVRKMIREDALVPQTEVARELSCKSVQDADVFYEQAIAHLAELHYQPLENFQTITEQLNELNLVYLKLKMGGNNIFIGDRRTGVQPIETKNQTPVDFSGNGSQPHNYADRHYKRAQEYMKDSAWAKAVPELKDAIKIDAKKSEYYSLLGVAYLRLNLSGTAKAYFRQALILNSQDQIASHFAAKFGIEQNPSVNGSSPNPEPKKPETKNPESKKSEPKKPESKKSEPKKPDAERQKGWFFRLFGRK